MQSGADHLKVGASNGNDYHLSPTPLTVIHTLFDQCELAQLTYSALDKAATETQESDQEEIKVTFPVRYNADKTAVESTRKYTKERILTRYQLLAYHQLPVNYLIQLVTSVETMLSDVLRILIMQYPKKLGSKRSISMRSVLESSSIEEIHLCATNTLLNELAYKSPTDFANLVENIISINLLECPAYHRYVEIKATRDIYIHNRGIANDIYLKKSGIHARVKLNENIPVTLQYYLESYESCLQITEWLESELHQHWHSSEREERIESNKPSNKEAIA